MAAQKESPKRAFFTLLYQVLGKGYFKIQKAQVIFHLQQAERKNKFTHKDSQLASAAAHIYHQGKLHLQKMLHQDLHGQYASSHPADREREREKEKDSSKKSLRVQVKSKCFFRSPQSTSDPKAKDTHKHKVTYK